MAGDEQSGTGLFDDYKSLEDQIPKAVGNLLIDELKKQLKNRVNIETNIMQRATDEQLQSKNDLDIKEKREDLMEQQKSLQDAMAILKNF